MSGSLSAAQALPLISQYESNNQNVLNTQGSSASGYYQIINGTWQQFAPAAGVDLTQYPTAMSAPQNVQTQVATAIYNKQGITPWSSDAPLIAAYTAAGNGSTGTTNTASSSAGGSAVSGTSSGSTGTSGGFVSTLLNPIWEIVSRGLLIFGGFLLVIVALIAMMFQSKTIKTSAANLAAVAG